MMAVYEAFKQVVGQEIHKKAIYVCREFYFVPGV